VVKHRKKEDDCESQDTFKHKHRYRKKNKPKKSTGSLYDGSGRSDSPAITESSLYSDFIDASYWKRSAICCGVIFVGQLGEVMVDQRFYKKCSYIRHGARNIPRTVGREDIESDYDVKEEEIDDVEFYSVANKEKEIVKTIDFDAEDEEEFGSKIDQQFESLLPLGLIDRN